MATNQMQWMVFDVGSQTTKAGIGGEDFPSFVVPSLVEYTPYGRFNRLDPEQQLVGNFALHNIDLAQMKRPVQGVISDFDHWKTLIRFCMEHGLAVDPAGLGLFLTEPPFCPTVHREKTLQIAMEEFGVPNYCSATTHTLSLYSEGLTTGMVCDLGYQNTQVVAVVEGYHLPHATTSFGSFGCDVDHHLQTLASEKGIPIDLPSEKEVDFRMAKEACCYISQITTPSATAEDKEAAIRPKTSSFKTRFGNVLDLGDQWNFMTKMLISPTNLTSLPVQIHKTANSCFSDMKALFNNIYITGGHSMVPGLLERLSDELKTMTTLPVRLSRPEHPTFSPWIGGSILTSLSSFEGNFVTYEDYNEHGPAIIHRKCF
jgi:actin